jgi:hypothetical protein
MLRIRPVRCSQASALRKAVRWGVFHRTVQDIRERNASTDPEGLQRIIDDTVSEVRADRYAKDKARQA